MKLFTRDDLKTLMDFRSFPCLSFYLPAQRVGAETRQSAVRLKNLVKRAEELLKEKGLRSGPIRELLRPVLDLVENAIKWEYQENGLAIFVHPGGLTSYQLPFPVEERITVSDHYRIKPLIPLIDGDGVYHILALELSETHLYTCTRQHIEEQPVAGLPVSFKATMESFENEKQQQHHGTSLRNRNVMHGFNPLKDSEKARIEEYLRGIDAVVGKLLARDRTPLVVACVDYLFPLYKSVSRYGPLVDRHIPGSPDTVRPDRMRADAWEIVRPIFENSRQKALIARDAVSGTDRYVEGILRILPSALHGRVEHLFLAESETFPGRFDPDTDTVSAVLPGEAGAETEDLYDLAAAYTFRQGGEVYLMDPARLPPGVSCVAVMRY